MLRVTLARPERRNAFDAALIRELTEAFADVGDAPAVISPFVFPRIGTAAARRYFLTGERFDAETALRIGLVHEVAAELDAAVERALGELLTAGPAATRAAKQLIRDSPDGEEAAHL